MNRTEEIERIVKDLLFHRNRIKEEYVRGWLAENTPDYKFFKAKRTVSWIINNTRLVETRSDDGKTVSWYMEVKSHTEVKL